MSNWRDFLILEGGTSVVVRPRALLAQFQFCPATPDQIKRQPDVDLPRLEIYIEKAVNSSYVRKQQHLCVTLMNLRICTDAIDTARTGNRHDHQILSPSC